jgi:hypothetical protein
MQMQAWSDKLFQISNKKFALCFKADCAPDNKPLTKVKYKKKSQRPDSVCRSCLRNVVHIDLDATVLVFWMPKGGEHVPPLGSAWEEKGKMNLEAETQCIFFMTGREVALDADGRARLRNGFKHEFWHVLARALNRASNSKLPVTHCHQRKL